MSSYAQRVKRAMINMGCPMPELDRGRLPERPIARLGTPLSAPGMAMFGTMALLIAHAPRSWHGLYDGPVRLAPAVVDAAMGSGLNFVW